MKSSIYGTQKRNTLRFLPALTFRGHVAAVTINKMGFLRDLSEGHERLKTRIHQFRIPLSRRGQLLMGCVYCGTPLLIGYGLFHWSRRKADENLGPGGALLRDRMTFGERARIREENRQKMEKIRQLGQDSGKNWAKKMDELRRDQDDSN